jgi:uncharacterized HAD superfamily protein
MKIGIDVDGVLADFNKTYITRCLDVTGKDLFPARPFEITTWNYPESYGYTKEEVSAVWESIKADRVFWASLRPYETTSDDMDALMTRMRAGDDVYFITARPGVNAKRQTEGWLYAQMGLVALHPFTSTVLITSHKGLAARTLDLDIYIDDRWENCLDVAQTKTRTFLLDRPWNRYTTFFAGEPEGCMLDAAPTYGLTRVSSVTEMLDLACVSQCGYTRRSETLSEAPSGIASQTPTGQ